MLDNVHDILIIKFKHIGDVLLSVPALRAVRETFPQAAVTYLLNHETAPMIEDHPAVSEVIGLRRDRGWWRQLALLLRLRRRRFDLVIDLSGGGDRGALWSLLSGARYRIGTLPAGKQGMAGKRRMYTHLAPTPDVRRHTVVRDLAVVRPFGIDTRRPWMDFFVPDAERADAQRRLAGQGIPPGTGYVVVHPTSRWLFKCADDAALARCIDGLAERCGLRVVVTCGPDNDELARQRAVLGHCKTQPVVFPGDLSLKALGAVIAGARLFIGVDSAPGHMAAALQVPTLVLFGPTSAANWGPWPNDGGEDPYPAVGGTQRAGRHVVLQQDWPCVPCGRAGCEGSKRSDCLTQIPAERILAEAERMV